MNWVWWSDESDGDISLHVTGCVSASNSSCNFSGKILYSSNWMTSPGVWVLVYGYLFLVPVFEIKMLFCVFCYPQILLNQIPSSYSDVEFYVIMFPL